VSFFNTGRGISFEAVFCFITSVSYLAGQFAIVATRYGSMVVAISAVTATYLLKVKLSS